MRRSLLVVVMLVMAVAALIAVAKGDGAKQDTAAPADVRAEPESGARAGAEELQEEAEVTSERLEALASARASGRFGGRVAATTLARARVGPLTPYVEAVRRQVRVAGLDLRPGIQREKSG